MEKAEYGRFRPNSREEWRNWLKINAEKEKGVWIEIPSKTSGHYILPYLESVLEALCFGWIDSIAKRESPEILLQKFTPRNPKSRWTEWNKERMRRLDAQGLLTDAGLKVCPTLYPVDFTPAADIIEALKADEVVWKNFCAFPELYQRIRIDYIEERRKQGDEFNKCLHNFIEQTRLNKKYGKFIQEFGL